VPQSTTKPLTGLKQIGNHFGVSPKVVLRWVRKCELPVDWLEGLIFSDTARLDAWKLARVKPYRERLSRGRVSRERSNSRYR